MAKTVYVCTGICKAEISEKQYAGGLTQCGAEGCTMKGHTFAKMLQCETCQKIYDPQEQHSH